MEPPTSVAVCREAWSARCPPATGDATCPPATGKAGSAKQFSGAADALPGRRLPRVLREFLETEAAGGVVLLVAAVVAVVWANSPWRASYRTLWHTDVALRFGRFALEMDLQH